jgi:hypothetical protein
MSGHDRGRSQPAAGPPGQATGAARGRVVAHPRHPDLEAITTA